MRRCRDGARSLRLSSTTGDRRFGWLRRCPSSSPPEIGRVSWRSRSDAMRTRPTRTVSSSSSTTVTSSQSTSRPSRHSVAASFVWRPEPRSAPSSIGAWRSARGPLCQKMDDDDWYAPRFLETMIDSVVANRQQVCRPTLAFLMPFLFFDVARWEVRRSIDVNAPGATLLFAREDWEARPFRPVRFDEDVWYLLDQLRRGGDGAARARPGALPGGASSGRQPRPRTHLDAPGQRRGARGLPGPSPPFRGWSGGAPPGVGAGVLSRASTRPAEQ